MDELRLEKLCKAPVDRVFAAWSTAEQVQRWFAPGAMFVAQAEVDFRVGGAYRIVMQEPEGKSHIVAGIYRDIVPRERLRFTWRWENTEVTSEVELLFRAAGEQTELTLIHRELPTEESRAEHRKGWEACLAKLIVLD